MHGFLTSPGFEAALRGELASGSRLLHWPAVVAVASGGAAAGGGVAPLDPVFARQALPDAVQIKGDSVRALAEAAYAVVADVLDVAPAGFVLHTFVPDPGAYAHLAGRAALLAEAIESLLHQRRRRAMRRLLSDGDPLSDDVLVVQSALVGRTSLLVSAARPRRLPHGGWDLAPWPAGIAPVPEDRSAPSRAYGKLEESFAWLGCAPTRGERCVDLGGAPGGWSWCALKRGAAVLAVDRAPLLPPAAGHPGLTVVRGDAFAYRPPAPVDWLLCDVICAPARTLATVERWMTEGWCRFLVATLKFKGDGGYAILPEAHRRLTALGWRHVRLKHLYRHHNEVAILATRQAMVTALSR